MSALGLLSASSTPTAQGERRQPSQQLLCLFARAENGACRAQEQQLARLTATLNLPGLSAPLNQSAALALLTAVNSTLANSSIAASIRLGSVQARRPRLFPTFSRLFPPFPARFPRLSSPFPVFSLLGRARMHRGGKRRRPEQGGGTSAAARCLPRMPRRSAGFLPPGAVGGARAQQAPAIPETLYGQSHGAATKQAASKGAALSLIALPRQSQQLHAGACVSESCTAAVR